MTRLTAPVHEQHGPVAIIPPDVGDEVNPLESLEPDEPWIHVACLRDSGDVRTTD
jgi:hypothetical protein